MPLRFQYPNCVDVQISCISYSNMFFNLSQRILKIIFLFPSSVHVEFIPLLDVRSEWLSADEVDFKEAPLQRSS